MKDRENMKGGAGQFEAEIIKPKRNMTTLLAFYLMM